MKKNNVLSVLLGIAFVSGLIVIFASPEATSFIEYLSSAFLGIAFTLSFGLGVSEFSAYFLTIVISFLIFISGFFIGKWLLNKISD